MTMFRHPDCPFECEIPSSFGEITHGVTYYGYSMTAIDVLSGNDAEIVILYSPTHEEAVEPYVEAFLDVLSRGDPAPEKSPFTSPLQPRVALPFEEPLVLEDGAECFHVAGEVCGSTGRKAHTFYGRAFVGEGRIDFKFSASTSVDDMKETWRRVLLSVRIEPAG